MKYALEILDKITAELTRKRQKLDDIIDMKEEFQLLKENQELITAMTNSKGSYKERFEASAKLDKNHKRLGILRKRDINKIIDESIKIGHELEACDRIKAEFNYRMQKYGM